MPPCDRFVFSLWWVVAPLAAQGTSDPTEAFTKVDTMIPMRDGVRLHTSIVVPKADHGSLPSWNDFVAHPNYDAFWQRQAIGPYLSRVTVPTLNVGGWWDQEDFYGPLKIYELSERHDSLNRNFLVVGPWNHGGWARGPGNKLGNIGFGVNTGEYFRDSVQAAFFAHYLKDKPLDLPEALTFEAGANRWVRSDAWPRRTSRTRDLYFGPAGRLSFERPLERAPSAFESYVSDPAHPVPYRNRPIEPTYYPKGSGWYTWLLQDQRFVQSRPDVLSWETEPLGEEVVVRGDIVAHLFAATTGSDADWIVKLIDVYPEDHPTDPKLGGYQLMVANDVFRGRYRNSFERPEPIVPNAVVEYVVDLHTQDYRFGSRSSIATRRPTSRTSSWPRIRTIGRRRTASTGPHATRRTSRWPWPRRDQALLGGRRRPADARLSRRGVGRAAARRPGPVR